MPATTTRATDQWSRMNRVMKLLRKAQEIAAEGSGLQRAIKKGRRIASKVRGRCPRPDVAE